MLRRLSCGCSCWSKTREESTEGDAQSTDESIQQEDPHQLDLSACNLSQLGGKWLRNANCRRYLHTLHLSANQLEQVPGRVCRCRALKYLDLSQNQLTVLPSALGKLRELTWLSVASNNLQQISCSFSQLKQLKHLDFSNNPSLLSIPANVLDCESLEFLSVSHTCVSKLPDGIER